MKGTVPVAAASIAALTLVAGALTEPAGAVFPGLNGKIAFQSDRDGGTGDEIYLMNPDGSAPTRLTNDPAHDSGPAFSPDGQRIAFTSYRDTNAEVYVMNADGSGETRLTNDPGPDSTPEFSPDGQRIVYASTRGPGGDLDIHVMGADGSNPTPLTDDPAADHSPVFSPDGERIAFFSNRDSNGEIYVMNADGSGEMNLSNNSDFDQGPDFSPDGTRIAFTRGELDQSEIYVMNANGSAQTPLTTNSSLEGCAAFSPDGQRIAFCTDRTPSRGIFANPLEIFVMNADGSGQTNLTRNVAFDNSTAWQPLGAVAGVTPLTLTLRAKRKQEAESLRAKVQCSNPCDVTVRAKGRAGGERFRSRKVKKTLGAGTTKRVKVRFKPRTLEQIGDEDGKGKLIATATDSFAQTAREKQKLKLKP